MLEEGLDKWDTTIAHYVEFIRSTRVLESEYVELKVTRKRYMVASGFLLWITISALIMAVPLTVPLGWNNVSKAVGKNIKRNGRFRRMID